MKLCSFINGQTVGYGALDARGAIIDLKSRLGDTHPTLLSLLRADATLSVAREAAEKYAGDIDPDSVAYLPLFEEMVAIHCVGLNYAAHTAEAGVKQPEFPRTFFKVPPALVGHGQDYEMPTLSQQYDYEGELAVIIGRSARKVSREDAMAHVLGYTCFMDGSVRDYQLQRTLGQGKNFAKSSSMGPWLVTADEVGELGSLTLSTRVSGEQLQHTTFDKMLFPVPQLIEYLSGIAELRAGDIIATGTPEGVGFKRTPPRYLKPGDTVEVEIDRVGTLCNAVR